MVSVSRNRAFDGLRGFAVFLVFLVHFCGMYMTLFRGGDPSVVPFDAWKDLFDKFVYWLFRSHHGVLLFFLLSGFLIVRITLSKDFNYGAFLIKRMMRIYPAFLLALLVCLAVGAWFRFPFPSTRVILLNLVFINGAPASSVPGIVFNNVTWSLFYEMAFYFLLPIIVIVAIRLSVSVGIVVVLMGIGIAYLPLLFGVHSELFVYMFVGGLAGTLKSEQLEAISAAVPDWFIVALYLVTTTMTTMYYLNSWQSTFLFSAAGFLILVSAAANKRWLAKALGAKPIVKLGTISYSFYLLHSVAVVFILLTYRGHIAASGDVLPTFVALAVCSFIGAIGISTVAFFVAERFYLSKVARAVPTGPSNSAPNLF